MGVQNTHLLVVALLRSVVLAIYLCSFCLVAQAAPSISGRVFVDFDRDGRIDAGETSDSVLTGLSVTAFDAAGNTVVATTSSSGTYTLDAASLVQGHLRIEFQTPTLADGAPRNYWPTFGGSFGLSASDSHTSVRFVDATTDIANLDFGVVPESECPTKGTGAVTDYQAGGATNSAKGKVFTTCWVNGVHTDATGPQDVLVAVTADDEVWYDSDGWASLQAGVPDGSQTDGNLGGNLDGEHLGLKQEMGALWGIAYDEWDGTLFTSAVIKRHVDLGPEGVDGLYWLSYVNGTGGFDATVNSISLDSLSPGGAPGFGADPGDCPTDGSGDFDYPSWTPGASAWDCRDLSGKESPNHDFWAFDRTGRYGIGDIDLTPDGNTLLVMNASADTLFIYDVEGVPAGGNPVYTSHWSINDPGCSNAEFEAWAVTAIDASAAYVGVTCTAQTSQDRSDLIGHVVRLDLTTGTQVSQLPIAFDYTHGCGWVPDCGPQQGAYQTWVSELPAVPDMAPIKKDGSNPEYIYWPSVGYHQPLLSDIGIDDHDGSLAVGVLSRWAMQMGFNNCDLDPSGPVFDRCAAEFPAPPVADYDNDSVDDPVAASFPALTAVVAGDLLRVCNVSADPDAPSFVLEGGVGCDPSAFSLTFTPPFGGGPAGDTEWYWNDQMGYWITNTNAHPETSLGGVYIGDRSDSVTYTNMNPTTSFGAGFSWDKNSNGEHAMSFQLFRSEVQGVAAGDPTFYKAASVGDVEGCFITMQIGNRVWLDADGDGLQDPGELPLQGITVELLDSAGNAVLDDKGAPRTTNTDSEGRYYFEDGLTPNTDYQLRFDKFTVVNLPTGLVSGDLVETRQNTNANAEDSRDSDISGGLITLTTADAGHNNHSYDAGFTVVYDLALRKTLKSVDSPFNPGSVVFEIEITNQGAAVERIDVADYINTDQWQVFNAALNNTDATFATSVTGGSAVNDFVFYWDSTSDGSTTQPIAKIRPALLRDAPVNNASGVYSGDASLRFNKGETLIIEITLVPVRPFPASEAILLNAAEISNFDNDAQSSNGDAQTPTEDGTVLEDVDSTPDLTDETAVGEIRQSDGGVLVDDSIWGDAKTNPLIDDEDDHDVQFIELMSIGSTIFYDDNDNGLQDVTEGSIDGVDVELYLASDPPGSGSAIASTTTVNGNYYFGGLMPGDYLVYVPNPPADAPQSSTVTDINDNFEDGDDNGIQTTSGAPVISPTITLSVDSEATGESYQGGSQDAADDNNGNMTVDFGFFSYDLALIKDQVSISPSPLALGSNVTYRITVMNQGSVSSGAYSVSDVIPAGMTFVSASPAPSSAPSVGANGVVVWNVSTANQLNASATTTFDVVLQVSDAVQSPFRNYAEITADSGDDDDSDPTDNSGSTDTINDADVSNDNDAGDEDDSDFETVVLVTEYDLALIKQQSAVSPSPANLGSQVTYTITVMNQGNVSSGAFSVQDVIPAGMTFVSASPAPTSAPGVGSAGTVQWDVPTINALAPSATTTFDIVLQVANVSQSPFRNEAQISADSGDDDDSDPTDNSANTDTVNDSDVSNDSDTNDEDDSDFEVLSINTDYDLALIKQRSAVSTTPPTLGTQVTYTITVMNQGNVDSGSFTVDDVLPAGMTYVSATPTPTTDPGSGNTGSVQWVVPVSDELSPASTTSFEVVVAIGDVTQSPFRNEAQISADSGDDDDSDPTDNSAGTDTFDDGDVSNDNDSGDQDDSDFDSLTVDANYDLALIKQQTLAVPAPAALNSNITYAIDVMNQGNVPSGAFTVEDVIPAGMTFVSATPAPSSDPGVGNTGSVQWLVAQADQLAPSAITRFQIVLQVSDVSQSPLRNEAQISADSGDDEDSDPNDNSANTDSFDDTNVTNDNDVNDEDDSDFATLSVATDYDLALIKEQVSASPSPAALNSEVTYAITVMNQGNVGSGTFTVEDVIPLGMSFVSATPTPTSGPGVGNNGSVRWTIPVANELAPGLTTTLQVVLKVDDLSQSPYRNEAQLIADSGDDDDSDPTDNSANTDTFDDSDVTNDNDAGDQDDSDFASLTVSTEYDLALIKEQVSVSPSPGTLGSEVTYAITVMNQGALDSGTFTVDDLIPAGMSFVSATPTATSDPGVGNNGSVRWVVPVANQLSSGATTNFQLVLKVDDVSLSPFRNEAQLSADSGDDDDSDPSDNSANSDVFDDADVTNDSDPGDEDDSDFATLSVSTDYDLALIKEQTGVSPAPAALGSEVTYTITVMNQGNVASGMFTVEDIIPPGMSFVSATPTSISNPGVGNNGTVRWLVSAANQLAPNTTTSFEVVLKIDDISQSPYRNAAQISADSGLDDDSDPTDNSATTDTFDDTDVTNDNDSGDEDDSDFSTLSVASDYDLALIKEQVGVSPSPAALGSEVTYTITVMNQGNLESGTFTVEDVIPAGMSFVSASPTATNDPGVGNTGLIAWVVPVASQLSPGATTSFQVVLTVDDVSQSPYRNAAQISADSGDDDDSDPADNSASTDTFDDTDVTNDNDTGDQDDSDFATLSVASDYDLALIKELVSVAPLPVVVGSDATYTITVMNQGNVNSGSFTVDEIIPAGMSFLSATPSPTSDPGVGNTGIVQWTVPVADQLTPGTTTSFQVILKIEDIGQSPYRNGAQISADSGDDDDSDPTNNSASTDTFDDSSVTNDNDPNDEDDSDFAVYDAASRYDLALIKTLGAYQSLWIGEGDQVDYDILVKNQGTVPSLSFSVIDTPPAGMSFVSASGPGFSCSVDTPVVGKIQCDYTAPTVSDLAPNATVLLQLSLRVDNLSLAPFKNWAEISSDSSAEYGLIDEDSVPGTNSDAQDAGVGTGSSGADASVDHNDIDHGGAVSDPDVDQDDSDPAVVRAASSTPVTLQSFDAIRLPDASVDVRWRTSLEEGNKGFRLYARDAAGQWASLTPQIIPASASGDDGAHYAINVRAGVTANEIVITDVDLFNAEVMHGPFTIGQRHGRSADDEVDVSASEIQAPLSAQRTDDSRYVDDRVYIQTKTKGVYRVSYEQLNERGIDWDGVTIDSLGLSDEDGEVPIRVSGLVNENDQYAPQTFGPGAYIEFIAERRQSLYSERNTYTLAKGKIDPARIVEETNDLSTINQVASSYSHTATWSPDLYYARTSPTDDPWYALKITAFHGSSTRRQKIKIDEALVNQPAKVVLDVWAASGHVNIDKDHFIRVRVNDVHVGASRFDGTGSIQIEHAIDAGVLVNGSNEVAIQVVTVQGVEVDTIYIDQVALQYQRRFKAKSGRLQFSDTDDSAYRIDGMRDRLISVYKINDQEQQQSIARINHLVSEDDNDQFTVRFAGASGTRFVAVDKKGVREPIINRVFKTDDLTTGNADLLIIAHPRFIGDDLTRLVQARQSQGLTVKVADIREVYSAYSDGNKDPRALRRYIGDAKDLLGTRYVLLVGGDTHDPKGHLKKRKSNTNRVLAQSLIPTVYASTGQVINYAPADPLLGDIDQNGVPDITVGRFPVQSRSELQRIIDKTLIYDNNDYSQKVVVVSDSIDDATGRSFAAVASRSTAPLSGWQRQLLPSDHYGAAETRRRFLKSLQRGRALSVYFGHSDKNVWSFDGLLRRKDIALAGNEGRPTAVLQFGCWNTYFVEPRGNSIAHRWLNSGDYGAALVMGPSTLAEAGTEELFAELLLTHIGNGERYGDALQAARVEMVAKYGVQSLSDLLGGFVLLGDPTLAPSAQSLNINQ